MHPLHLTAAEKMMFEKLPTTLREGWEVQDETQKFQDTDEYRASRMELMKLHDPQLLNFRKKVADAQSQKDLQAAIEGIDFSTVSNEDFSQLFFGMGPDVVTTIIMMELSDAKSEDDVELIAAMTNLRHMTLKAFIPAYS